jgi:hypothetical protein
MQGLPEPSAPTTETRHRQPLMQDLSEPSTPTTDTYASSNQAHSSDDADFLKISGDNAGETSASTSTPTNTEVMSSGNIGGANSSNLSTTSAVVRSVTEIYSDSEAVAQEIVLDY